MPALRCTKLLLIDRGIRDHFRDHFTLLSNLSLISKLSLDLYLKNFLLLRPMEPYILTFPRFRNNHIVLGIMF